MSTPAPLPSLALQPFEVGALGQMLIGLVIVLVLMWVAVVLIRRFGISRLSTSGPLKVVAGLPLGPRERVILMQVDEVRVLVGISPAGMETLYVQGQGQLAAAPSKPPVGFETELTAAIKDVSTS